MSFFRVSLTIAVLHTSHILCSINPSVINYTLTVIEHLGQHQLGRFDCVFLAIAETPITDNGFENILKSPRLNHITKYVLNDSFSLDFNSGIPRSPALLVVNVHAEAFNFSVDQMVMNPNTRILILFENSYFSALFFFVMHFFKSVQFTQIVCLESTTMVFIRIGFDGLFVDFLDYVEPGELFRNILRDMNGRAITYSDSISPSYSDNNWMQATGQYLNATPEYVKSPCPVALGVMNDCYTTFMLTTRISISLDGMFMAGLDPETYRMLFDVIPTINVIAVPMPRSLNVLEIFSWPYSLGAWIILALIIVLLELLNIFVPGLFSNDPILLVVCGFQRYDLYRAHARERLICVPLIIFFFLMINAYETRIISYMIDKPSIGKIQTIREMLDSGLKLAADKSSKPGLFNDSQFVAILVDISNNRSNVFDRESAYYGNGDLIKERLRLSMNYDHEKQQPAYYILDEIDGMVIYSNWLPLLDPLLEMFHFTRRALFEAGLLDMWFRNFHDGMLSVLQIAYKIDEVHDDVLDIADMSPTWIALAVGYCLSVTVFAVELAFGTGRNKTFIVT
ncbi:hypothetical protein RP20_CCG002595 [Aedes albopictus]|nr:hypothetical protein RP20_CCG002595 [Aedes albopictus]